MVTVILNLPKRKHTFKLDDDPGSPEWVLDLSDGEVTRLFPIFAAARDTIQRFSKGEKGVGELAEAYRTVIAEALGEDAYAAILEYITDGSNDAEESTIYLAPVVTHLFKLLTQAMTMRRNKLAEKYVGLDFAD